MVSCCPQRQFFLKCSTCMLTALLKPTVLRTTSTKCRIRHSKQLVPRPDWRHCVCGRQIPTHLDHTVLLHSDCRRHHVLRLAHRENPGAENYQTQTCGWLLCRNSWRVAGNIGWAWIFTIPASAFVAGLGCWLSLQLF